MIVNDREWKFLAEQTGLSMPFNDLYFRYLRDLGYTGTLQDMIAAYGYGLTPSKGGTPSEPVNLVVNGTFDTDTVWTKGPGWTIAGGVAVGVPDVAVADLSQPVTLIAGQYQVDFDVVTRTAGAVRVLFDGGALVLGTNRSAVGHYSETLVSDGNTSFAVRKNTLFNGSIDNVELYYLG